MACAILADLGSTGIIVDERKLDTFVVPDPDEVTGPNYTLKAFFAADTPIESLLQHISSQLQQGLCALDADLRLAWRVVGDQDWAEGWKQHFTAVRIGRDLVIRPSWETESLPDAVVVTLDPGMAFGTGTHGTTRLCLEFIARLHDQGNTARRVLDVGTGSGILAIAAVALGAHNAVACDIDPVACDTTRENAAINNCSEQIWVTQEPLESISGDYDLVVANILAEENVRLATALCARVAPGGYLVLSGILEEKVAYVTHVFNTLFDLPPKIDYAGEWACIQYQRGA